jgi:hypothetical protein
LIMIAPLAGADDRSAKPLIQLAILLDTSNSMDGLIDQARTQLWSVVNTLARTQRNGQSPELQVALYQYGNTGLDPRQGWVQQVLGFTDDLDKVSEKLFALKTNGGDEYCGWVIRSATNELAWSAAADTYKVIFIAGNEPFSQGSVDFHQSCKDAIARGIMINTIHCGSQADGVSGGWKDGATLADGQFTCIDQNQVIAVIPTPQDKELAELSGAINTTYIPYGKAGAESVARQAQADAYAVAAAPSGAVAQRCAAKGSGLYQNGSWDLVDAVKNGTKLEAVEVKDLPENLQKMTAQERQSYVDAQQKKRSEMQAKIGKLSAEREKFLAENRRATATTQTLDSAMNGAIREQLAKKEFAVDGGR